MCTFNEGVAQDKAEALAKKSGFSAKVVTTYTGGMLLILSTSSKKEIGRIGLETISPGLDQYAVSTGLWVDDFYRGTLVTDFLDQWKEEVARNSGIKALLALVRTDNAPELARMFKGGWKMLKHTKGDPDHLLFCKDLV